MGRLGNDALIIGAGMGGLAAAAAVSPHFDKVTILDRDAAAGLEPRQGVGQGAHAHLLLKAGAEALEHLAPGLHQRFAEVEAPTLHVGRDLVVHDFAGDIPPLEDTFPINTLSRPRYEAILREAVLAMGNVALRADAPVERALIEAGRCGGVELADGERVPADLVVDASGMGGPMAARLAADGAAEFDTEQVRINVSYTSALFQQPLGFEGEERCFYVLPGAPDTSFAILMPVEERRWMVSLGMRGRDTVSRELPGFLAFAEALPRRDIHERLKEAPLLSEIRTFRKAFATRRRFGAAARWPERLVALGDAMTSFNPTFGQGMSVAALQARALGEVLAARDAVDGLGADYFPAAERAAEAAWSMALATDYTYPQTERPRPPDFEQSNGAALVMRELAARDPEVLAARLRVAHMLDSPEVFRQGALGEKVAAAIAAAVAAAPEPA